MSRMNRASGDIDTTQHQPLRATGTPIGAFARDRGGKKDDGSNAAAEAVRKLRSGAGAAPGRDDDRDEGDEIDNGSPRRKKAKAAPAGRSAKSRPEADAEDDADDDEGDDDEADEGEEDEGDEEAEDAAPKRPAKKAAKDKPKGSRTEPNADYSRSAESDEDAEDEAEGDEEDGEEAEDPDAALVQQYRDLISGKGNQNGQGNNGQNGQQTNNGQQVPGGFGHRPPEGQNAQQQQHGQNGQQQQRGNQGGGGIDSIFSQEEIQSLNEDGNEAVAKVLQAVDQRLGSRLAGIEQLLGMVSTDAIERLGIRKVRTATEDNKFFGAADSPYRKSFKDQSVRAMVSDLASRMQRDQMSRAQSPVFLSRDEALRLAARVLLPGVEGKAERQKGRTEVEERIKKRHRQLSIAPSGGQRGGSGNPRTAQLDDAAAAIGRFKQEHGIA